MGSLTVYIKKQAKVVGQLAKAAEQIPPDKTDWKPSEESLPWLFLIHHTAIGRREVALKILQGKTIDFPACLMAKENQVYTPKEAAKAQHDSWAELKEYIEAQPIDLPTKEVTFPGGFVMTVERLLWMVYDENVHHRGQAWLYARINGITPPKIWGARLKGPQ